MSLKIINKKINKCVCVYTRIQYMAYEGTNVFTDGYYNVNMDYGGHFPCPRKTKGLQKI